jgi:hypothetical protein
MRNASILAQLPAATGTLADLENAFDSRRRLLQEQVRAATLVGRILHMFRSDTHVDIAPLAQPSMSWVDGPRTQPRDGRGRFLPREWLADAELFLPADRAWFRSALSMEVR